MNDEPIKEVTSHKHLGIFFSNDGTWHQHIDYITSKAWIRLNIMRKLKFILDRQSLEIIYRCIVRPANRDWACQTERCHTLSNKTSLQ